jgi:hypothetical protein
MGGGSRLVVERQESWAGSRRSISPGIRGANPSQCYVYARFGNRRDRLAGAWVCGAFSRLSLEWVVSDEAACLHLRMLAAALCRVGEAGEIDLK